MAEAVLDASVLLAFLRREPGRGSRRGAHAVVHFGRQPGGDDQGGSILDDHFQTDKNFIMGSSFDMLL